MRYVLYETERQRYTKTIRCDDGEALIFPRRGQLVLYTLMLLLPDHGKAVPVLVPGLCGRQARRPDSR